MAIGWYAAAAVSLCVLACPSPAAEDEAKPLPVGVTAILKNEPATYYVQGRQRIPKGVELTVLRGIRIVARGKDAVIEVEGQLSIHGVSESEVVLEDVTIEPQAVFQKINMSQVFFQGGGIRTAKDRPCAGYFMVELTDFVGGATLDVALTKGSIELATLCAETPVKIRAVDTPGTSGNGVTAEVRGCASGGITFCPHKSRIGLRGGLEIDSANEVVVRLSRLGGLVAIRDWRKKLIFDGNKVDAARLEFTQPAAGRFEKAQFAKCDIYGTKLRVHSPPPANPKQTEAAVFDRWYFHGSDAKEDAVRAKIEDGAKQPEKNGARAELRKIADRPLELGGAAPK